jgi:hypothetical protein
MLFRLRQQNYAPLNRSNDVTSTHELAYEIAAVSSYPAQALLGLIAPDGDLPDVGNARKRELLMGLQPYLSASNGHKNEEAEDVRVATGCRSSRDKSSGLYVYHEESGVVDPDAFATKYGHPQARSAQKERKRARARASLVFTLNC